MGSYGEQRRLANRAAADAARMKQVAALQAERDKLLKMGIMDGEMPRVHDQMSPADMTAAARRLSAVAASADSRNPQGSSTGAAPAAANPTAQIAQHLAANPPATKPPNNPSGAPGGTIETPFAFMAPPPLAMATEPPPPAPAPLDTRTPLERAVSEVPFESGMTADVRQTGAGLVTTVPGSKGPRGFGDREVAVSPTFEQVMHAKTGGAWAGMTPPERAQWLRAHPVTNPMDPGEVTDPGLTAPDLRGMRGGVTAAGPTQFYDPREDTRGTGGLGGMLTSIEDQYGGGKRGSVLPPKVSAPPAATLPLSPAPVTGNPAVPGVPPPAANTPAPTVITSDPGSSKPFNVNSPPPGTPPVADNATPSAVDDIVDPAQFAGNEEDDQFKKKLAFNGFA